MYPLTAGEGTGEAIRGNVNAALDTASGDRDSAIKNADIASKGAEEIDHGYYHTHGTGAGVTPVDTASERAVQGTQIHAASTNLGSQNKLDPRYGSDLGMG